VSYIFHYNIFHPEYKQTANYEIFWIGYYDVVHQLEIAEMTPELRHDLTNFSFDCLQDVIQEIQECYPAQYTVHYFSASFLQCLKNLVCHIYSRIPQILIV